jgi:hypothetical protein
MRRRSHHRPTWRRRLWLAIAVALAAHAVVLVFVRFPSRPEREAGGPLVIVPGPADMGRAAERRPAALEEPGGGTGEGRAAPAAAPRLERTPIPAIRESPGAAEETTIPSTALTELRAATLPLVPTEAGIARRRIERSPEELAIARAESLLVARMAGIAVVEARDVGAVGLANGGITVAIPWEGFLPADRRDGEWRRQRCEEGDGGDGDKAGEGEARRAQC